MATSRGELATAAGGAAVLTSGVVLAAVEADRYPVSASGVVVTVIASCVGVGLVLARFRWTLLGLGFLPLATAIASVRNLPGFLVLAPVAMAAGSAAIAAGVVIRKRADSLVKHAGARMIVAVGCLLIALSLVPAGVAYIEKHRAVRVHRSTPVLIDADRGTVGGIGIGDQGRDVIARFGRPVERQRPARVGSGDTQRRDFFLGPPVIPRLAGERDFSYPHEFFALSNGRVRYLEVTDRNARFGDGLGPGDSITLVPHLYPRLICNEGDAGSDEPYPYPRCYGRLGSRIYAYLGAEYHEAGSPIKAIWLADFPFTHSP